MSKQFYVYILASKKDGVLYIGVTSDLIKRIYQHKEKPTDGFTKKYNVDTLVYFEIFDDPENAIHREKRLKKYTRDAKIKLIEKTNPDWQDLYSQITGQTSSSEFAQQILGGSSATNSQQQDHPRIATQFG